MNYVILNSWVKGSGGFGHKAFGPYTKAKAESLLAAYFVRTQSRIKNHGLQTEQEVSYVTGRMDVAHLGVHVERWEVIPLTGKMEN